MKKEQKRYVLVGDNTKRMYSLIIDFIHNKSIIKTEKKLNLRKVESLCHLYILAHIAQDFIIRPEFEEEKIKVALIKEYNDKDGIENFIYYCKILEDEKEFGFKNLSEMIKKKIKAN